MEKKNLSKPKHSTLYAYTVSLQDLHIFQTHIHRCYLNFVVIIKMLKLINSKLTSWRFSISLKTIRKTDISGKTSARWPIPLWHCRNTQRRSSRNMQTASYWSLTIRAAALCRVFCLSCRTSCSQGNNGGRRLSAHGSPELGCSEIF